MKTIYYSLFSFVIGFLAMYCLAIDMQSKYENVIRHDLKLPQDTLNDVTVLYYLNLFDIKYPSIVLAQAKLETNNFKSELCLMSHNLFGLKNGRTGNYYQFSNFLESIIIYKWQVQSRHKQNENYYNFLERIGYAEDSTYIFKLKQF